MLGCFYTFQATRVLVTANADDDSKGMDQITVLRLQSYQNLGQTGVQLQDDLTKQTGLRLEPNKSTKTQSRSVFERP